MTRFLFPVLGLPLLIVSGPAPADTSPTAPPPKLDIHFTTDPPANPPYTVAPLPKADVQFKPAPPVEAPYTVVPPGVLLQLAPVSPQPTLPMVIVQVDPSKYPMVTAQGVPGHYPMVIVPVPGGQMDAPSTTVPYQAPLLMAPITGQPLKLLITPPTPAK